MKTPEEYIDDFWGSNAMFNKSDYDVALVIQSAQTEAWNEAIREANRHAKAKIVSVKSAYKENAYEKKCVVIESSILNLIKK